MLADLRNLKWGDWLYTLIASGISAAASVVAANPLAVAFGAPEFTPRQLGIFALSAALVAMAGILKKSPLPDRALAIALLPGVHTPEQVDKVLAATAPGTIPSREVTTAILGLPAPSDPSQRP